MSSNNSFDAWNLKGSEKGLRQGFQFGIFLREFCSCSDYFELAKATEVYLKICASWLISEE